MAHSSPDSKKLSIRLSILNRHPTADWTLDLRVHDMKVEGVEVHEMWSDDLSAKVSLAVLEYVW
jgi:alpha-N-arabinofuranosidase